MSEFDKKVYMVVQNIPCGYVMNYGMVAELAGYRTRSRQVGRALHNNPDPEHIPCHRVVMKDGSLTLLKGIRWICKSIWCKLIDLLNSTLRLKN